jgi:aromatic-L-amino-acid decarboxylase
MEAPISEARLLGDIPVEELRVALHRAADWIVDFRAGLESRRVTPTITPGEFSEKLPAALPDGPTPVDRLLAEFDALIPDAMVHWSHPLFLGYFGWTTTGPGILGEMLTSVLNVNAMTWRTSPAATELETRVLEWIRRLMHLPDGYLGVVYDTASVSTMHALAVARERAAPLARTLGLAGRDEVATLRVYCSDQAHSSIEKGLITLGLGQANLVRVPSDDRYRMDIEALREAIASDRNEAMHPMAVIATAGTTSTASVDPLRRIAELCRQEGIWLHVDAAYGGALALLDEEREVLSGLELADSIVVNPHKWLFVPLDFSVLFTRHPAELQSVFSVTPEYLRGDASRAAIDYMDFGLQLGRRFRALKAWMVFRAFGADGLRARIREHCRLARTFASWVQDDPAFELVAPVTMGVVCFRALPEEPRDDADELNARIHEALIEGGGMYLTRTRLAPGIVLRIGLGNVLTTEEHLRSAWELIREARGAVVGR